MPLEWMDDKEYYPGYIAYNLLITCEMCHGVGQLRAHELDHTQFSYMMDKEAVSKPVDIDIIIIMCSDCNSIGRIVDMNKWNEFRCNTEDLSLINMVKVLLNDFFLVEHYGGGLL